MALKDEIRKAVKWDAPSIESEETLRDAIQKMVKGDSSALLVKIKGTVVGVVTEMDLMRNVVAKKDLALTKVSEIMTPCEIITDKAARNPCVQLHETESVENALGVLETAGLHNLVVTGKDEKVSGIASARDLLELAVS